MNTSESSRNRLCLSAVKCDQHCELFGQRFLLIRHESESHRESHSICTREHCKRQLFILSTFDNYTLYRSGSGARVTVCGMSGVERQDPVGTDPIDLQLPRSATSSGTPQTSMPSVTRLIDTKSLLQVTPYHGDKASFLGCKWSFLIAVRAISKPLHEGLKKIEDNINQDFRKSRLSAGDLELSDQAYTLLALLCKDEACAYVRSAEDGNGYQAWQALLRARTARNATNLLNQLL